MRHRLPIVTLGLMAAVAVHPASAVQAQSPRIPEPTLRHLREIRPTTDTTAPIDKLRPTSHRSQPTPQAPEAREGINVGWTVLGAVLGFVAYQSATADSGDGDFAAPFSVILFIGVGAALGTLLGMILA